MGFSRVKVATHKLCVNFQRKNVSLHEETWQMPSPSGDQMPPPEMGPIVIRHLEVSTPGKDMASRGAVGVSQGSSHKETSHRGTFPGP